jgi:hypothetical protein
MTPRLFDRRFVSRINEVLPIPPGKGSYPMRLKMGCAEDMSYLYSSDCKGIGDQGAMATVSLKSFTSLLEENARNQMVG